MNHVQIRHDVDAKAMRVVIQRGWYTFSYAKDGELIAERFDNPVQAMAAALAMADTFGATTFEYDVASATYEYDGCGDALQKADSLGFDSEAREDAMLVEYNAGTGEAFASWEALPEFAQCELMDELEQEALDFIRAQGYAITGLDDDDEDNNGFRR